MTPPRVSYSTVRLRARCEHVRTLPLAGGGAWGPREITVSTCLLQLCASRSHPYGTHVEAASFECLRHLLHRLRIPALHGFSQSRQLHDQAEEPLVVGTSYAIEKRVTVGQKQPGLHPVAACWRHCGPGGWSPAGGTSCNTVRRDPPRYRDLYDCRPRRRPGRRRCGYAPPSQRPFCDRRGR